MAKYIRTKDNEIIVFTNLLNHCNFSQFEPVSAGFISFGVDNDGNPSVTCYGDSATLKLKSDKEKDSASARKQILGFDY